MVQAMQISSCTFLSDSQQLVQFLHPDNQDHPPHWRMKPYSQTYANIAGSMEATLFKINRTFNSMADTLAKQAQASTVTELAHACTRSACGSSSGCTIGRPIQCSHPCSFLLLLIYVRLFLVEKKYYTR